MFNWTWVKREEEEEEEEEKEKEEEKEEEEEEEGCSDEIRLVIRSLPHMRCILQCESKKTSHLQCRS